MYPTDFEAKTSHLTLAEDGAYNRLIRLCWMTPGCSLPDDEAWIMRRARAMTDDDKQAVRTILAEFFTSENGRLSNARIAREWAAANEAHSKRKDAGAKGGKAKALNLHESKPSNAVAMPKQPEPEPEPDIKERDTDVSLVLSAPEPASPIAEAVMIYNETADATGWPKVQKLSPARSKAIKARLRDCGGIEGWRVAMDKGKASDFLCGRTPKVWTGCGFDWITKQANFAKLMEGNYDNRDNKPQRVSQGGKRPDPALEQILRLTGLSQASVNGGGGTGGFGEEDGSFRLGP
jgi:uncharacterized protein YdaU (DUF1376 family)